jgi:glycosyltransferase involved in cell wall biosynthesis
MQNQNKNILIIIPVRNVAEMISETLALVNESDAASKSKVLIIDNKSDDNTVAKITNYIEINSKNNNFETIVNHENLGYGGSLKKGLNKAISENFNWTIVIHGDNQTDWKVILNQFVQLIETNEFDIISTTRFSANSDVSKYSKIRIMGNQFFRILTKWCTNLEISDPGVAIMAFKTSLIKDLDLNKIHEGYMFHPQLNIMIFEKQNKFKEIPMYWQDAKQKESFNLISYGLNLSGFLLKYGFYTKILNLESKEALLRCTR